MPDYTDLKAFGEFKSNLESNNFNGKTKQRSKPLTDDPDLLSNFAKIAAFLRDQTAFLAALDKVSAELWDAYRGLPIDVSNKFTRCLGQLAMRHKFQFLPNTSLNTLPDAPPPPVGLVLTGGNDPDFLNYVRDGVFWKDVMNARHGEHTHSLQWLAIAESKVVGEAARECYQRSADYACNTAKKPVYLWGWLVDSFPSDGKSAAPTLKTGGLMVADDFRTPQILMDYLVKGYFATPKLRDSFVATYLFSRYASRKWLTKKTIWDDEGQAQHSVETIQARDITADWTTKNKGSADVKVKTTQDNTPQSYERITPVNPSPARLSNDKNSYPLVDFHGGRKGRVTFAIEID